MDDGEPSAPRAPIDREDLDDTVEAHYACLEWPHACLEGWVFVGRLVVDEDAKRSRS